MSGDHFATNGETVLIVEDDAAVAGGLSRILEGTGLRVLTVAEPRAAIALIADTNVTLDLIVLDIMLPGMSGFTVAEKASRLRPGIGILYISGTAILPHDEPHPELSGGVRFLSKPLDAGVFIATVHEMLV